MMGGMGCPAVGIVAMVIATAFLVWVCEKNGNPAQAFGKVIGWIATILAILLLIGQIFMCSKMCAGGQCMRMMGKGPGMGMMQGPGGMSMPTPPAEGGK